MAASKKPKKSRKTDKPNKADEAAETAEADGQDEAAATAPETGVSASLGAFIRGQREMANLSLRQLSAMTEISNAYLSQIERDLHEPSIRILTNVGRALGISPEVLLARAGFSDRNQDEQTEPPVSTEDAIEADPYLTAEEKQALLTVYRSYRSAKK